MARDSGRTWHSPCLAGISEIGSCHRQPSQSCQGLAWLPGCEAAILVRIVRYKLTSLFRPLFTNCNYAFTNSLSIADTSCEMHSIDSSTKASTTLLSLVDKDWAHPDATAAPCTSVLSHRYRVPEGQCHDCTSVSSQHLRVSFPEHPTTNTEKGRKAGFAAEDPNSPLCPTFELTLTKSVSKSQQLVSLRPSRPVRECLNASADSVMASAPSQSAGPSPQSLAGRGKAVHMQSYILPDDNVIHNKAASTMASYSTIPTSLQ